MSSGHKVFAALVLAAGIGGASHITHRPQFAVTATSFVALNLRTGMARNAHPTRSWANLPPCSPRSTMSVDEFPDAK